MHYHLFMINSTPTNETKGLNILHNNWTYIILFHLSTIEQCFDLKTLYVEY